MKKIIVFLLIIALGVCIVFSVKENKQINDEKIKIVTSFYPLYIMTSNLTEGINNIEVSNMTNTNTGCLHNYTLQVSDLKNLSGAQLFIINGMGMETFLERISVEYPNVKQVNTSNGDMKLVKDSDGINGHIWNSVDNYLEQVEVISNSLCSNNSKYEEQIKENTEKYMAKLNLLKQNAYIAKEGTYVVSCNEALAYLLNGVGLKFIELYSDHDQSALSSETITNVVKEMKEKNIKVIFVEKNDDIKNAEILANETGAKIYKLDATLTGELNNDAYINAMTNNFNIMKECLE